MTPQLLIPNMKKIKRGNSMMRNTRAYSLPNMMFYAI